MRLSLAALVLCGGIFLIAPLFMSASFEARKAIAVATPAEEIYPYLTDPERLQLWEPWYLHWRESAKADSASLGLDQQAARVRWELAQRPDLLLARIRTHIAAPVAWSHRVDWQLTEIEGGTRVDFALESQVDYPVGRWKLYFFEDFLVKYTDASLENLKIISEQPSR